jgi:hypothetical protein
MSKWKPNDKELNTDMNIRYKDGKVDQVIVSFSITRQLDKDYTGWGLDFFDEDIKKMINKMKQIFGDMYIRVGSEMVTVNQYCEKVIGELK